MPLKNRPNEYTFSKLEKRAIDWWETKRPLGWDVYRHLKEPFVNVYIESEKELIEEIVQLVTFSSFLGNDLYIEPNLLKAKT